MKQKNMRRWFLPALAAVIVIGAATLMTAQRGGRGGAGAGPGTIERVTVHGKSLEGNLEGDSPDRPVAVYLPPGYARDTSRRYPVVYLLHGYGGSEDTFLSRIANLQESADALAPLQGFSVPIVVMPSANTLHGGSMYADSPVTGDWERFIAEDLITYIDSHYRTIANRNSRGIAGHSMGAYGALRIALKRPEMFLSLYLMSACCLTVPADFDANAMAAVSAVSTRAQAEELVRLPGEPFAPSLLLAVAAAASPNPSKPPLFLDLPFRGTQILPEILAKWRANSGLELLKRDASPLRRFYTVAIDVGTEDTLLDDNRQLHQELTRQRVFHSFEEYKGDHTNRIKERMGRNVLPFFSKNLAAPANPTSPSSPPQ